MRQAWRAVVFAALICVVLASQNTGGFSGSLPSRKTFESSYNLLPFQDRKNLQISELRDEKNLRISELPSCRKFQPDDEISDKPWSPLIRFFKDINLPTKFDFGL